jgi:hypothetical protein
MSALDSAGASGVYARAAANAFRSSSGVRTPTIATATPGTL